jgi:hypothetical protein
VDVDMPVVVANALSLSMVLARPALAAPAFAAIFSVTLRLALSAGVESAAAAVLGGGIPLASLAVSVKRCRIVIVPSARPAGSEGVADEDELVGGCAAVGCGGVVAGGAVGGRVMVAVVWGVNRPVLASDFLRNSVNVGPGSGCTSPAIKSLHGFHHGG